MDKKNPTSSPNKPPQQKFVTRYPIYKDEEVLYCSPKGLEKIASTYDSKDPDKNM